MFAQIRFARSYLSIKEEECNFINDFLNDITCELKFHTVLNATTVNKAQREI